MSSSMLNNSVGDEKKSVKSLGDKENQLSSRKKRRKLGCDEFAQAIARIAVAQVCEGLGFQSFQQVALDCLADVGSRYIREIGKVAGSYANLANRTQCNVFDVIQCLEDLGSVQGFSGISNVGQSLSGSGVIRDLIRYVNQAEEIPFAYKIPAFPIVRERKVHPSSAEPDKIQSFGHIPPWLPKFPDPSTYIDPHYDSSQREGTGVENLKKLERPLNNTQKNLICNGSEARVAVEPFDVEKGQSAAQDNPFLAPPLHFDERGVSLPGLPARLFCEKPVYCQSHPALENPDLSLKQSLQDNEALRNSTFETEDRRNILLNGRPVVKFKLMGRKELKKRRAYKVPPDEL